MSPPSGRRATKSSGWAGSKPSRPAAARQTPHRAAPLNFHAEEATPAMVVRTPSHDGCSRYRSTGHDVGKGATSAATAPSSEQPLGRPSRPAAPLGRLPPGRGRMSGGTSSAHLGLPRVDQGRGHRSRRLLRLPRHRSPRTRGRGAGTGWPRRRRRERGRRPRGGEEGRAAGACSRWGAVALPPPPPREREGGAVFFLFPRKKDRSSSEESNSGFGEPASGRGCGRCGTADEGRRGQTH